MSKKNAKGNEPSEEQKRAAELREMKKNDPSFLKEEIFRLSQQLSSIIKKKNQLENEIANGAQQYTSITYEIQAQIKKQEDEIISMEEKLAEQNSKYLQEMKKNKRNWEQELENTFKSNEGILNSKRQEKMKWERKAKYLEQYPERKFTYQTTIAQLDAQLQRMILCHEKDIKKIHNHHHKARIQFEQNTQKQIENIKSQQVNKLEEKMTKQQHIKKENEIMSKEIDLCQSQKKILEEECDSLKSQIENEKTKMSKDLLGDQASETYERSLRIIQLQGKMSKLKIYLAEETARLEKEYEKLDEAYTKKEEDIDSKTTKIQGWLRIKERDLKKLKACSQMVLNQRSTLESYLLEVFYEHPEIDHKDERNMNKILRCLFVKVNSKKPPISYKNYLNESHHSMDSSINSNY